MIIFKHRDNLDRIRMGTERQFDQRLPRTPPSDTAKPAEGEA
jgi:hypothetical protein